MKKAIISLGGSQHIVQEGDVLRVTLAQTTDKKLSVPVLATIDGSTVNIGSPEVKGLVVELTVEDQEARAKKVTAIRYKAKKRVLKIRGHRQSQSVLKVSKIG